MAIFLNETFSPKGFFERGKSFVLTWTSPQRDRQNQKMTKIFLQGTPDVINTESIRKKLLNIENINNIHDMHLWTLDGSYNVLSLHLVLDDVSSYLKLYKAKESTKKILREFNIEHATIEIESEGEECELLNCLDDTNYIKR